MNENRNEKGFENCNENRNENSGAISCEIIGDLLPLYVDNLASDDSRKAIREHVENCTQCRSKLKKMESPLDEESIVSAAETADVDAFKKVRNRNRNQIIGSIAAAVVLIAGLIFAYLYILPVELDPENIDCTLKVEDRTIRVIATCKYGSSEVTGVEFEETDGVVGLKFKGHRMGDSNRKVIERYAAAEDIASIAAGDIPLWQSGTLISNYTAGVYMSKHDYVGDAPANSATAEALGLYSRFGGFTNELGTGGSECSWTIELSNVISTPPGEDETSLKETFTRYSCALMAVIGNLNEVTFKYRYGGAVTSSAGSESPADIAEKKYTVTLADADKYLGRMYKDGSVKKFGTSAGALQHLFDIIGLQ